MLTAPSPKLNSMPPAKHPITLIIVELRGVSIGTIINRRALTPSERRIESLSFCFAITLIVRYIEMNQVCRFHKDKQQFLLPAPNRKHGYILPHQLQRMNICIRANFLLFQSLLLLKRYMFCNFCQVLRRSFRKESCEPGKQPAFSINAPTLTLTPGSL